MEIVETAQEIAVRIDQHEHPQAVRLLDGQHARRRPAEALQLSHDGEGGMQRVEVIDPQAGAAGRLPRIDRDGQELQRRDAGPVDPFGFSWRMAVSLRRPAVMRVGFPWILSSESRLINGLRGSERE